MLVSGSRRVASDCISHRDSRAAEQPRTQQSALHTRRLRTPCWTKANPNEAKLITHRQSWPSSRAFLLSDLLGLFCFQPVLCQNSVSLDYFAVLEIFRFLCQLLWTSHGKLVKVEPACMRVTATSINHMQFYGFSVFRVQAGYGTGLTILYRYKNKLHRSDINATTHLIIWLRSVSCLCG